MRSAYTEEEIAALDEVLGLIAGEVERCGAALAAYIGHIEACEDPNHRALCVSRIKRLLIVMMDQTRYGSWIEAEMAGVRMFENPAAVLRSLKESQEREAIRAASKIGKVYEGDITKSPESAAMDAMANAPSTETKQ